MKIKENIAISENGFIFDSANGESYSVNPIGIDIINWMKSLNDANEIKLKLIEKYNVDEITAEKDLFDFISMLKQYDLLNSNDSEY